MTTIYLVRHGQSQANVAADLGKPFTSSHELGSELTELGINQAKKLAEKLKDIEFAAVFSSDLLRAHQTAEILKLERKLAVETRNTIREFSYGVQGEALLKMRQNLQELMKDLTQEEKMQFKMEPHHETRESAALRLINFLREIAVAYDGKNVLVVNHGALIRYLLIHLGWASYDELYGGWIENTGYVVLESDGVDFKVRETSGINKKEGAEE